jgi:hypothetical protein
VSHTREGINKHRDSDFIGTWLSSSWQEAMNDFWIFSPECWVAPQGSVARIWPPDVIFNANCPAFLVLTGFLFS